MITPRWYLMNFSLGVESIKSKCHQILFSGLICIMGQKSWYSNVMILHNTENTALSKYERQLAWNGVSSLYSVHSTSLHQIRIAYQLKMRNDLIEIKCKQFIFCYVIHFCILIQNIFIFEIDPWLKKIVFKYCIMVGEKACKSKKCMSEKE